MIKVMFVCLGNICRSPMAEYVFKNMVREAGLQKNFQISSAATSYEEEGNSIYPPAARTLKGYGVPFGNHKAHRLTAAEIEEYDYIIGMESRNIANILRISSGKYEDKIHKLLDFCGGGDISDPWYSGDFEATYRDVKKGCKALLEKLKKDIQI